MIANGHCRDVEESFDEVPDYTDIDIRQWPKTDEALGNFLNMATSIVGLIGLVFLVKWVFCWM